MKFPKIREFQVIAWRLAANQPQDNEKIVLCIVCNAYSPLSLLLLILVALVFRIIGS